MRKYLTDLDAHRSGMFRMSERLSKDSKAALLAVVNHNEARRVRLAQK